MSDVSLGNLRFADYSVNLGSIPSKFDIAPDLLILSRSVIPQHNFKLEKEIIAKADKENAIIEQERRLKAEEIAAKERQAREAKEMDSKETESKDAEIEASSGVMIAAEGKPVEADTSPLLDLDFDTPAPTVTKPASADFPPVNNELPSLQPILSHDATVAIMVEQTKQDKDVCYFYLECADWNLESAIELLKSMQSISN